MTMNESIWMLRCCASRLVRYGLRMMVGDDFRQLMDWSEATPYSVGIAAHSLPEFHWCKLVVRGENGEVIVWASLHGLSLDEAAREVADRLGTLA